MTDQAFAPHTIKNNVRKIDFLNFPKLKKPGVLEAELNLALRFLANPDFYLSEIQYAMLGGKPVAQAKTYRARLAIRKLDQNLKSECSRDVDDRRAVVQSLQAALSEAVKYNLYKLDIRQFYESFDHPDVIKRLKESEVISNSTRRVVNRLLEHHLRNGLTGIPRGLSLSSTLSELMMERFDEFVEAHKEVFFYRRYVDDLVIITSQRENSVDFLNDLSLVLTEISSNLAFKSQKHCQLSVKQFRYRDAKKNNVPTYESFEYLGYEYNVAVSDHQQICPHRRHVWLDIAPGKVAKIKKRLVRSYLAYLDNRDFNLLDSRVRHLTSNMSLLDRSQGVRRMVGIHFNYPLVDYSRTKSLHDLDSFFQSSLKSTKGRVFRRLHTALTPSQKEQLSRHSFFAGAKGRHFYQMGVGALGRVQRCWKYE